ncbi:thiolase family protein [Rhizobium sp. Rhizsp82]|uniref:thiolase family protein n=1 Tax=Rhizobium sp. Rhizsp82 TaxID=3243057 RepID=UPI0039B37C7C
MSNDDIVICSPVRTAIGAFNGSLRNCSAVDLGAAAIGAVMQRTALSPTEIDSVIMGNVVQAGNKMNPGRQAALHGGLPVSVPAYTVNRVCGSGAQAVISATLELRAGLAEVAIAGGMENMDRAPYLLPEGRWGHRLGVAQIYDSMLTDGLEDAFSGKHSGWHTEDLVQRLGIPREAQDEWAERSQSRFSQAQNMGNFSAEIVSVTVPGKKGAFVFDKDEAVRADTNVSVLARLRPAFRPDGTITAGNAPGLNSGASAMIVTKLAKANSLGIEPAARIAGIGVAAVEPAMFGLGPVPAIHRALANAGWKIGNLQRVEINEAYAAVPLAVMAETGLSPEIVNVEGGAIAHGHPIGATGAVLLTRLIHSMKRDGQSKGLVALCIGGGQGIAVAIEL